MDAKSEVIANTDKWMVVRAFVEANSAIQMNLEFEEARTNFFNQQIELLQNNGQVAICKKRK